MHGMQPSQPRRAGVDVEDWIASQVVNEVRELISQRNLDTTHSEGEFHSLFVGTQGRHQSIDDAPIIIDDGGTVGRVNIVVRKPVAEGSAATRAVCQILRKLGIDSDRAARGTGSDAARRIFSLYRK